MTGRSIRDETVDPSFDLIARLRSRRLRWAGQILRLEEVSLSRRMLLAMTERDLQEGSTKAGGLLEDAPAFDSVEQLLEAAEDKKEWRAAAAKLLPPTDPEVAKWKRKEKKLKKLKEAAATKLMEDCKLI